MTLNVYLYFLFGLFYDVLITLYYIAINDKKPTASATMSFIITFVQCYVTYSIVVSPEVLTHVLSFSLGCAVGTGITVWWKRNKEQENGRGLGRDSKSH